jgi:hypothetical protein
MSRAVKAVTVRKDNIEVRIERRKETQMVHIPVHETAQDVAARTLPLSRRPIPVCPSVRLEVIPAGVPEPASVRAGCWREALEVAIGRVAVRNPS